MAPKRKFKQVSIGSLIISHEPCWNEGLIGRVIHVDSPDSSYPRIGVQFDVPPGGRGHGHNCDGRVSNGGGWYFYHDSDFDLAGGPW